MRTIPHPVLHRRHATLLDQPDLFANDASGPEGLDFADGFVTTAEERDLVSAIADLPLQPFQFGQYEGKRRVASFGFNYDYTARRLVEAAPIPQWLSAVAQRVETFGGSGAEVRQILCTEYDVGVGIGWHRDKPQFDRVFGLSLGSDCKLRFRRAVSAKWERFALEAELDPST
jgi:alkylated DNA repair dioxygenase AlkB